MACNCPVATALTTITATGCPEEIGQIQRAWFVRKGEVIWDTDAGGLALNNVPAGIIGDVVEVIAGWNTLKIAPDSTKVVFQIRVRYFCLLEYYYRDRLIVQQFLV